MILDTIKNYVAKDINPEELVIKGVWGTDFILQSWENERIMDMKYFYAQTIGQGCAFTNNDLAMEFNKKYIGKNYLDVLIEDRALDIAILDSILYTHKSLPSELIIADGSPSEKAEKRAEIVVNEVLRLSDGRKDLKIVNVGVIGLFIKGLSDLGFDVIGTDFDESIIGLKMFGKVDIISGTHTLEQIVASDIAIVTGMTLTTDTIDEIIKVAKNAGTKVLIYAQTGANFADFYIADGIETFIGEEFPIYGIQGRSKYNIYRKTDHN